MAARNVMKNLRVKDYVSAGDLRTDIQSSKRYFLEENFAQAPLLNAAIGVEANLNFEVLGENMTSALSTFCTTRGGIRMTTAGADDDQSILLPHLDTKQTAWTNVKWGTENQTVWESTITTGDDVATGLLIWAGLKLTNTPVIATDANQVFFRFSTDDSDTEFVCESSIAGVDTATDSGVTVEASTEYKLKIKIDEDRKAQFYINDELITTTAALTNDIDLIPYIGIQALSATAEFIEVHNEKISRLIYE